MTVKRPELVQAAIGDLDITDSVTGIGARPVTGVMSGTFAPPAPESLVLTMRVGLMPFGKLPRKTKKALKARQRTPGQRRRVSRIPLRFEVLRGPDPVVAGGAR